MWSGYGGGSYQIPPGWWLSLQGTWAVLEERGVSPAWENTHTLAELRVQAGDVAQLIERLFGFKPWHDVDQTR